jgi:alpha-L-arabinofuranosidase
MAQGKGDKMAWDPHYSGDRRFADRGDAYLNEMGINLQKELAIDHPGFKLHLHPMEENGSRCDWDRGLAHAHNWNTNQRYGDSFTMLGTANTFQPHGLHYMWDQGRIHYTADTIWFQPSAHVDEMIMKTWKPTVVKAVSSDEETLDVTAKISENGNELSLYVVNTTDKPADAVINIANFKGFKSKATITTIGDCELTDYNTYADMNKVVPVTKQGKLASKNAKMTFPKYSFTVITVKK